MLGSNLVVTHGDSSLKAWRMPEKCQQRVDGVSSHLSFHSLHRPSGWAKPVACLEPSNDRI